MGDWEAYQDELRTSMVTINGDLTVKIKQLNQIQMEFEGFREYLVNLEQEEEALFIQCKEVEITYTRLIEEISEIEKILVELRSQQALLNEMLSSWRSSVENWSEKWLSHGEGNLFTMAQDVFQHFFDTSYGFDHDNATEE